MPRATSADAAARAPSAGSLAFAWPGGRSGVLLIHGLGGTPTEMRFVARGLHAAGFTVHAVQLAGHCGTVADLVATGWRDWRRSVEEAADALAAQVDHVFVAGLSMGAVLALELAIARPDLVRGVGCYGTTFRLDGWAVPLHARLSVLLPLVCGLGLGRERQVMERHPYGIKDERTRAWVVGSMLAGDSGAAGLPGTPWGALAEFVRLSRHVRRRLGGVRAPCLVVHSSDDDIASLSNVELIQRRVSGPVETVLLDDSYHIVPVDRQRGILIRHSVAFFRRVAEECDTTRARAAAAGAPARPPHELNPTP
ncbi:MAG: alpha/beta fold hydrolase [Rhizobacter sp.]|nr:alpha/beta fold hydrolase [Rhizobacter sp.]